MDVRWYLTVLICFPHDQWYEASSMCLLAICISSLVKRSDLLPTFYQVILLLSFITSHFLKVKPSLPWLSSLFTMRKHFITKAQNLWNIRLLGSTCHKVETTLIVQRKVTKTTNSTLTSDLYITRNIKCSFIFMLSWQWFCTVQHSRC